MGKLGGSWRRRGIWLDDLEEDVGGWGGLRFLGSEIGR